MFPFRLADLPKFSALVFIRFYQKTISPDHGVFKFLRMLGYCRYHPTCSEYAYQAISKYGFLRGGIRAVRRLFRCTPFAKGGFDPVK